jgi:ornithine cyclodeaminase/alanine dehydrogenase-like protein (mu-crystallin family)
MSILVITGDEVRRLYDVLTAIDSQRGAFDSFGRGEAQMAPRTLLSGPDESVVFVYTARVSAHVGPVTKVGSVNPGNAARGLPTVQAVVLVLDAQDGRLRALVDGTSVTTLRTAAASAVAVQTLAMPGAREVTIIGAGVQARAHISALAGVLDRATYRVWAPRTEAVDRLVREMTALGHHVVSAPTVRAAVEGSPVVACCTNAMRPVLDADWVDRGCTVVSIGSFAPDRCEVGPDLLARAATIVVDDVPTACEQAGPVVAALAEGSVARDELVGLGEVIAGLRPGRASADDVVFYNSVGLGIQDAAAVAAILERAIAANVGTRVDL